MVVTYRQIDGEDVVNFCGLLRKLGPWPFGPGRLADSRTTQPL